MAELTATIEQRASAAQEAHTRAWRMQRRADQSNDPIGAGFWRQICDACLEELADCDHALRAGVDAVLPNLGAAAANDGIQRGNTDLPERSGHATLR